MVEVVAVPELVGTALLGCAVASARSGIPIVVVGTVHMQVLACASGDAVVVVFVVGSVVQVAAEVRGVFNAVVLASVAVP